MKSQTSKPQIRKVTLFLCVALSTLFSSNYSLAQATDGDLSMSILSAYNLIVDSNVESPSTYAPTSVHFGVTICNNGSDDMTDVVINIGDYSASPKTPGLYRQRTVTESTYAGTFSFTHVAATADATRTVSTLAAGDCSTQYWLVEYPRLDPSGNSVTGGSKPDDDLWLEFDVWASADDNGTSLAVNDTQKATMRSEISAMANKVYPNGDNKVPQEYLDAIEGLLGWRPDTDNEVGSVNTTEGIWYDLGRINKGFDNDGDFVPDYNVFLQPVGDPNLYDPSCFRLVKTYGLIIIKKTDGTEQLIPFEDQTYFSNLPADNNGAVGLVYYDFVILNAPCYAQLSPYQEVASGSDNEKFNGDFGVFTGGISTTLPNAAYDATGPATADHDTDITYNLSATNNGSTSLGVIEYEMPPVVTADIPEGTNYVAGSAATSGSLPSGSTTITIKYSTDNGATWTTTEPVDPSTVTNIQWWMDTALEPGETLNTTFKVQAPSSTYTDPLVEMESGLSLGNNDPFLTDTVTTLLSGINSIGDSVFEDNGAGSGTMADGFQNGSEAGIDGIDIYLYFDQNGDGVLDEGDIAMDTTTTSGGGLYTFNNLPDGNFIVEICKTCVTGGGNHNGWGMTSAVSQNISLDTAHTEATAVDVNTIDFGFTPALSVEKTITSATPAYEGQEINYNITVNNLIAANPGEACNFGSETVLDQFTTQSYSNNDGSTIWATDWQENGESNGPTTGDIYVHASFFRLVMGGLSIQREVNLTCATTANLSFIHRTQSGSGTAGQMTLEVSTDGSSWQTLDTYSMATSESTGTSVSYDLMPYRSTNGNTYIRLAHNGGSGMKSFDDIQIAFEGNGASTSGGSNNCTHDLWIGYEDRASMVTHTDMYGAPDGVFATGPWGGLSEGAVFTLPDTTVGSITKVEGIGVIYNTNIPASGDDLWQFKLTEDASANGFNFITVPFAEYNSFSSSATAGEVVVDLTAERSNWYWSDFTTTFRDGINLYFQPKATGSNDGMIPYIDAFGFRITTDETCSNEGSSTSAFDPNTGLGTVPLQDVYNPDSLEFVSASITPSSIDEVNGIILWDNIGPISAGDSKSVTITFKAKEPLDNSTGSATNTGIVSNALFGNGDSANTDTSSVSITIEPTGTISGLVWSDSDADGWIGSIGYESGTDYLVANTAVSLYSCTSVANNGSCNGIETLEQTVTTDASGAYLFEGVIPNLHYRIAIDESSLPGTVSQTGDPDDDPTNGTGNGGTCGNGGSNESCDAGWTNGDNWFLIGTNSWASESWDLSNINFGYAINPSINGSVWEDIDGDGSQGAGELGISGVSVELQNGSCTAGSTCPTTITDADGNYSFENLTAGINYTISVITSTLPNTATWTETAESDASINNAIPITLSSGETSNGNTFGFNPAGTASIGDQLFYDFDEDGVKDASDEGIPNVDVILYKDVNNNGTYESGTDAYVTTATTDATGTYSFGSLAVDNYLIVVDNTDTDFPSSVLQSGDPDEVGPCTTCDGLGVSTTTSGGTIDTLDFGYKAYGAGSIGDLVWKDINGDGAQLGAAETGIENITVELWGDYNNDGTYVLLTSTTTDANGNYLFDNLADGNYKVVIDTTDTDLPTDGAGNLFSNSTSASVDVSISGGTVNTTTDFGFAQLGSIGDMIFWDANANGTLDWTEEGVSGVTVYICSGSSSPCNSGNALFTTTTSDGTDGNPVGSYQFTGLAPGSYTIGVETTSGPLAGTSQTSDPDSDGLSCSDPELSTLGYPACDNLNTVTVNYGTNLTSGDFGYQPAGVIGDFVWLDADNDNIQDSDEPGIGDATVILTNASAVTIDGTPYATGAYIDTVYTDLDGYYSYSNLPDGTYDIEVVTPTNHTASYDADGGSDNTTQVVISGGAVASGSNTWCSTSDCSLDVDFGFRLNGTFSLSGSVCIDDGSEDGVCNTGGESMLSGDIIYLYDNTGTSLGQTTVDMSGTYSFNNLPAGAYTIAIGTSSNPLDKSTTTTSGATTTSNSVYQTQTISTASLTDIDFGFINSVDLDLGDLPASYELTKLSEDGAYHEVPSTPTLYLGSSVNSESDPIQNANADGDTSDDGITLNAPENWTEGTDGGSFDATVNGSGWLVAWIDFNQDGDFSDSGEMITSQAVSTGTATYNFDIPTGAILLDESYARFRLFESEPAFAQFSYTGAGATGEVEDYAFSYAGVLPVELTLFMGRVDECNVALQWESQSEIKFSHYEIQRSRNNIYFETINIIEGQGGQYFQQYYFTDKDASKDNYYRLKLIDLDGSFVYSDVINVQTNCGDEGKLLIYPNPILKGNHNLNVRYQSTANETSFSIINSNGVTMQQFNVTPAAGWNVLNVDVSELPSGIYFIKENTKSGKSPKGRFIIQE